MVGLRGVGKTVLLNLIREEAEASDIYALPIEAPENQSLPSHFSASTAYGFVEALA